MLLMPDFSASLVLAVPGPARRMTALVTALLIAGCAAAPERPVDNLTPPSANLLAVVVPVTATLPADPAPSPPPPANTVQRLLDYAQRVRTLTPPELNQEVMRLGAAPSPAEQLQLALVLGQLQQKQELARAQELLGRVLGNPTPQAQVLHPLAGLLASRFAELRRLEDQLEKQTQQTRDTQRRLDQTTERLEALKAIERSLTNRSPAASPTTPARRSAGDPPNRPARDPAPRSGRDATP